MLSQTEKKELHVYLPSVECTWASVMINQQKVCSFHREHAMAPGVDGLVAGPLLFGRDKKRLWLKMSKPTGLKDAHHWPSHLWSRPREALRSGMKFIPRAASVAAWFHREIHPVTLLSQGARSLLHSNRRNGDKPSAVKCYKPTRATK